MAILYKVKRKLLVALGASLATMLAFMVGQKGDKEGQAHVGINLPPSIAYADAPGGDGDAGGGNDDSGGSDSGNSGANTSGCSFSAGSTGIGGTDGGTDGGPGGPGDGP